MCILVQRKCITRYLAYKKDYTRHVLTERAMGKAGLIFTGKSEVPEILY